MAECRRNGLLASQFWTNFIETYIISSNLTLQLLGPAMDQALGGKFTKSMPGVCALCGHLGEFSADRRIRATDLM